MHKTSTLIANKLIFLGFCVNYFSTKISRIIQTFTITFILINNFQPIYAENVEKELKNSQEKIKANGLLGIPKDEKYDSRIKVFNHYLYMLPYFHVQVGIGAANTEKIAQQHNTITKYTMPTFMIGIGFQQQYYILGINTGYKIQLSYEVGIKSLNENTTAFRDGGIFFQVHAGYKYILPHINFGYEMLSVGNEIIPSSKNEVIYTNKGIAYGYGITILLDRYNAVELDVRHSKIYGNKPRFLFNYEFRF